MKIETLQFHPTPPVTDPLAKMLALAEASIYKVFEAGRPLYCAYSGGKDSSVVADLSLRAAVRFKAAGGNPIIVVGTSNTLMENPEIYEHYVTELAKMEAFGAAHGLNLQTAIIQPSLASTWQVKVLSGRGIPSFPGGSSDCTSDLKIVPQNKFRKSLFKNWSKQGFPAPVTVLGVRREESVGRAARMRERGDSAIEPVLNKAGDLVLAPIADWTELDVFEHLGNVSNGLSTSYSDFKETDRIYAHSAGSACSIVAMDEHEARKSPGCGARHGCWGCQKAEDKSLEAMIAFDPRYEYARGLNKLNKLIRGTRYEWQLRSWVGRTIKGGYVEIKPDTYRPAFLRALTRYMLQLDYDENKRARAAGEQPKFSILPAEMMIAVDALQSLNGLAPPFQIWADYRDIYRRGIRYDIPEVIPVPATPMPQSKYLYVGSEWDDSTANHAWTGLRSDYMEGLCEDSPCMPALKELKDGTAVWDLPREMEFSVNSESAYMIVEFEIDHLLNYYDLGVNAGGITFGYKWYAQYGALTLSHGQLAKHDEVLRRTAFKDRVGLTMEYSVRDLLERAVTFAELPAGAKAAWKPETKRQDAAVGATGESDIALDPAQPAQAEPVQPGQAWAAPEPSAAEDECEEDPGVEGGQMGFSF